MSFVLGVGLLSIFPFLVFGCYLYIPCVLRAPFPSAFNVFALFTYKKKKKKKLKYVDHIIEGSITYGLKK